MLARAARRNIRRDALRSSPASSPWVADQLALPFLCPAQMRWAASVASSHSRAPSLQRQSRSPSTLSRLESRSLATAADVSSSSPDAVPFQGLMQAWGTRPADDHLTRLPHFDPARPLVVHHVTATAPTPTTPTRFGVGGDPVELHQNLYACLRVGRFDRATAILRRLSIMYNPEAPEIVDAHNVFLQAMVERAVQGTESSSWTDIEAWYKTNMVHKAIASNADTYVTLLRAAMALLPSSASEDVMVQYLVEAEQLDPALIEEINASAEFTDDEWNTLISLQSDRFDTPPATEELQEMQITTPGGQALAIQHGLLPDPALAVKPVEQKGLGLSSLKQALATFEPEGQVAYPHEVEGSQEEKDRTHLYMRQLRLESDGMEAAVERWRAEDEKLQALGIHGVLQSKPIQALMWQWRCALAKALEKEMATITQVLNDPSKANAGDDRHVFGPWLEGLSAEKLASLTVSRVLLSCTRTMRGDSGNDDQLKITPLSIHLGRDVEAEVNDAAKLRHDAYIRKLRRKTRKELLARLEKDPSAAVGAKNDSTAVPAHALNTFTQKEFPLTVKTTLGAMLLEKVLETAKITIERDDPKTGKKLTSTQPAFRHSIGFTNGKRTSYIKPQEAVNQKLRGETLASVQCIQLPMLIEPKPWASFEEGGYFTVKDSVVRVKPGDGHQKAYAISAIDNGDMSQVLAGLDVLGRVPWTINHNIYRVMLEAWNKGEGVAGLVPEDHGLQRPAEPAADAPMAVKADHRNNLTQYENKKGSHHSQRCFQNFQLEVARAFLNDKFYYPHSVDFRGRAYPIPPILNHIGADFSRGLLQFGNGKELGEVGLQWLKVHLANLFGYDKASLSEREQFALDHIKDVYDSATNPLGGDRWWTKAEDPWQCLACCFELKAALDLPDPSRHVCHLPVHQDGTCNGLQHYAALGGDEAGANQVNLEPSDRPQDIYTGVAELVKQMVAADAKKGKKEAVFIDGKITRKVVKRTVMTNVYGVTFIGAKQQVQGELEDMFPNFVDSPDNPPLFRTAQYIAKQIFAALGKIFNGAQDIQYWLSECGDRITTSISADQIRDIKQSYDGKDLHYYGRKYATPTRKKDGTLMKKLDQFNKSFRQGIIWTTPLRMPVVQPYRKDSHGHVKSKLQSIKIQRPSLTDVVDKRRQLQGFPPNFIHSLDASHMLLSALKCSELGLDFAAVHDSFWTHAADIPRLNEVLRDAFVRMHSEDIVGRLAAEFDARYAGSMYYARLRRSSKVAQKIVEWRRQLRLESRRSSSKADSKDAKGCAEASFSEVALEARRQELLNSEDEALRKEGEEMVTPTSIWLSDPDPLALSSRRLPLLGDAKGQKVAEARREVLGAEAKQQGVEVSADAETKVEDLEDFDEAEMEGEGEEAEKNAGAKSTSNSVKVWIPLTFPPVPQKGGWDVKRLLGSKYFFS